MLKAICFHQEWFVPNVTALRTYSNSVLFGKLYSAMQENAIVTGATSIKTSLHYDSNLNTYCGRVDIRDCKMVDNKIWLSCDQEDDNYEMHTYYFKLDDVLADKNCELVMGGVNSPAIYLLPSYEEAVA